MDLRTRLILALSPLIIALLLFGLVAFFNRQRVTQAVDEVNRASKDLVEVAQSESLILLEQYNVSEIIAGHQTDRNMIETQRAMIRSFLSEYTDQGNGSFVELELAARFEVMVAQHDAALTVFDRGNREEALEMISSNDYHRNIRAIHSLVIGAQREYEIQYLQAISHLERIVNEGFWLGATVTGVATVIAITLAVALVWQIGRHVDSLTADAERLTQTETDGQLSPVGSINQLRRLRDAFQHLLDVNRQRQQQLATALQAQQAQLARELELQATIRALSLPVTPLGANTIFLPLVGHLDTERGKQLEQTLLDAIQQRRARKVVIDVSGLATFEEETLQTLIRVGQGARLLGAQSILVGVRADQALHFTQLPSGLFTYARDIPAALTMNT
ncbi:MAG: STAS domain-containing protein [Chloroflexus sp.]|jgi:anti-anti-sigma regulatory factor/biopolymer transport protein ExbB/TolQ|uniref:STAS domain-containing protein n=1 Tax=Chloroflexus sp. TaxID=1904827 RepID=UPI00309A6B22